MADAVAPFLSPVKVLGSGMDLCISIDFFIRTVVVDRVVCISELDVRRGGFSLTSLFLNGRRGSVDVKISVRAVVLDNGGGGSGANDL